MFGGSGAVGGAVVGELARAGIPTTFTYHTGRDRAAALSAEHGARAMCADLREAGAVDRVIGELVAAGEAPDVFVHCAVVSQTLALSDITDTDMQSTYAVNCRAAFEAARALAPSMAAGGGGDIVFVGAISANISARLPADFTSLSALRRTGTPAEAARAIAYLALENHYMNGKVLSVNGGI